MALTPEVLIPRIGDVLVEQGKITKEQLQVALDRQRQYRVEGKNLLLGQILVESGMIDRDSLDQSITQQIFTLQNNLRDANANLEHKVQERTAELEIAYRKLSELTELKANFVSNISHELRTPLTHINGYLDLILTNSKDPLSVEQTNLIMVIKRAAGRLERLIDDLILFSTSETNRLTIIKDRFDPSIIIYDVYERNLPTAEKKGVFLEKEIKITSSEGLMDKNKIAWVMNQLVDNAIKFTESGGKVTIHLSEEEGRFLFRVIDSGIGIAANKIQEIFEPFHQLDGSSTRIQGGTGLGLALAEKILTAHHSKIEVTSAIDKGSVFSFAIQKS